MSRMVQARVTDAQYNDLHYRALEFHEGDLSQAIREAVSWAAELNTILDSSSPPEALVEMIERKRRESEETRKQVYMDESEDA